MDQETEESIVIEAKFPPKIEILRDANNLTFTATHDMGFEKIQYAINGEIVTYDEETEGYDKEKTEFEKTIQLETGEYEIVILVTSNEGTQEKYIGKTTVL